MEGVRLGHECLVRLLRTLRLIFGSGPRIAAAGFALVAVQAVLPVILLFLLKRIVDLLAAPEHASLGAPNHALLELVSLAALVALAESLAGAARRIVGELQAEAVSGHLHDLIHGKSIEVGLGFYEDASHRDSLHRAQQLAPYRPNRLVSGLQDTMRHAISLTAVAGVLIWVDWRIVPALVLSSVPGALLRFREAPRFYDWWQRQTKLERVARYFSEVMTTAPFALELRLYQLGNHFRSRFLDVRRRMREASRRLTLRLATGDFVAEAIAIAGLFGVFALLGVEVAGGALSLGSLVMGFGAMQRAWMHFGGFLRGLADLREDDLLLQDLYRFLDIAPTPAPAMEPRALPPGGAPEIRLIDVRFRYAGMERDALDGINLTIAAGERVALVGHNGSGKSTLIKLISRLYDPTAGRITVDGVDLRELSQVDVRSVITVVSQDTVRYQETAGDNIRFGAHDLHADATAIELAARRSGAAEVIAGLPAGYDTKLGNSFDGGHELSPGEWQKVALARGFVRDARVILLDEPTSAMDARTEDHVLRGFEAVARGRTSIVISHRLSTVMTADRIHVLEGGRIIESGSHEDLMRQGGVYANMFEMQAARYR